DLLVPIIKERIVDDDECDLESDPMQIYKSSVNNEELRTGRKSSRKHNVGREEAIRDPETRDTFVRHLHDLRDLSDAFIDALEDNVAKMPYGIRYIANQAFEFLCERFPNEPQDAILQIVEHFIYQK